MHIFVAYTTYPNRIKSISSSIATVCHTRLGDRFIEVKPLRRASQ